MTVVDISLSAPQIRSRRDGGSGQLQSAVTCVVA